MTTKILVLVFVILSLLWIGMQLSRSDEPGPTLSDAVSVSSAVPVLAPAVPTRIAEEPSVGSELTSDGASVLQRHHNSLQIVTNASSSPPQVFEIGQTDENGIITFDNEVHRLYIEVGTNDEPEMGPLVKDDPHARLVAFEPQPPVFEAMLAKFKERNRLIPIPAAVAPKEMFLPIHVSEHRGCTSLLPLNQRASNFARKAKEKAPKKGIRIQLRTIEFCASQSHRILIPAFPLSKLIDRLPPKIPISVLMTDAQGFDTTVLSTLKRPHADRVQFLVTECQDLQPGHQLFLVNGAPSCHQQRKCIEKWFPHRLDFCWDNAPKVRELNCIYRHPGLAPPSVKLPPKMKLVGGAKNISYEIDGTYECPSYG